MPCLELKCQLIVAAPKEKELTEKNYSEKRKIRRKSKTLKKIQTLEKSSLEFSHKFSRILYNKNTWKKLSITMKETASTNNFTHTTPQML